MFEVTKNQKLKVAILGSGNIGIDLLIKVLRSPFLKCTHFVGRNPDSQGISIALNLGINVSSNGIDYLKENHDSYSLVFDATSAEAHHQHAPILKSLKKKIINLTPATLGKKCVPAINVDEFLELDNISMITCGGQAAAPIAYAISQVHQDIEYIEVVSSISSKSAGYATRQNLDEYITTTENAIIEFSNCKKAKAILNINPAFPYVDMKTTIYAKIDKPHLNKITNSVLKIVDKIQGYVPYYELLLTPQIENERIIIMVKVRGSGDYLPSYAGNLDIITSAAVAMAEATVKQRSGMLYE